MISSFRSGTRSEGYAQRNRPNFQKPSVKAIALILKTILYLIDYAGV